MALHPRESALSDPPARPRARRGRRALLPALAAAALAVGAVTAAAPATAVPASTPDLGSHVLVFDPSMPTAQIQAAVDAVASQQVDNQFGTDRWALLFEPGTYGSTDDPLVFQVGYYTEVAGLGQSPSDVTINGHVDVYNQCDSSGFCVALNNFWRSMSNLTINVMGSSGCHSSGEFWAASQAAPVRRVIVTGGNLTFMDYCSGPSYASGGFLADSKANVVINGSQQQYYVRDSSVGLWTNAVWNQVFSGVQGAPAQSFPNPTYTTLATTPVSREKPYLYVDRSGHWRVFVPAARHDASGPAWAGGDTTGTALPLSTFYVAHPSDSAATIDAALATGKNLLITPGVYAVDHPITVTRPGTVVLGLGFPTVVPTSGTAAITVADVPSVKIAGLMVDAGPVSSPVLVQVGSRSTHSRGTGDPADPTSLQDVFVRVGGATAGRATTGIEVNSSQVILDDIWAWRADHGAGVGWTQNTADSGLVVNGDDVTATGLAVEHFQKTEVVWNGERGRTVFFQNEMPYDVPDQAAWMDNGVKGYPAYQVAASVRTHEAWGLGSYSFFNQHQDIHAANAFVVPETPGVAMHDLLTIFLDSVNGSGAIDNVINGTGGPSSAANADTPVTVTSYP